VHCCAQAIYEAVAHAIEEASDSGATLEVLAEKLDAPFTQVAVALAWNRRPYVKRRRRRPRGSGMAAPGV
jgi:hypothetical protein